jgi:hypothetical protein
VSPFLGPEEEAVQGDEPAIDGARLVLMRHQIAPILGYLPRVNGVGQRGRSSFVSRFRSAVRPC